MRPIAYRWTFLSLIKLLIILFSSTYVQNTVTTRCVVNKFAINADKTLLHDNFQHVKMNSVNYPHNNCDDKIINVAILVYVATRLTITLIITVCL